MGYEVYEAEHGELAAELVHKARSGRNNAGVNRWSCMQIMARQ